MGSNRPNIATAAIDAMLSDYIQQCGTPSHNNDALRPEQNADGHSHNSHLRIDTATAFHQPSDSIHLDELFTPGCLFDLPEYDHQDETLAAPPSTQRHPDGSNLLLPNARCSNTAFKSTLSQQRPAASPPPPAATPLPTLLPDAVLSLPFHPPPSTLPAPSPPSLVHLPPQHAPFQPPHTHQSTATTPELHALLDDPLRTWAPFQPALPPLTLTQPATITAPPSPDTEALLNDPLTATLIAAQLHTTRPRTHRPPDTHTLAAAAAAPPIAKPRRKKLRPKDTIDALQQHLDGVTEKMRCLSLRNRQLHKQKLVLDAFVRGLARYQDVAALVKAVETQGDEASEAPACAAALRAWTPDQFVDMYKEHVAGVGQWITRVEASASGAPSDADVAELRAATQLITQATLVACNGRTDFIPRVMAQLLKLLPEDLPEEEHWRNVLGAVNLTEGQVEDLLAAREVYLRCSDNVGREHDTAKATLQEATQLVLPMDGNTQVEKVAAQVKRMAAVLRKHQGLATMMFFFWFEHTLTPLQVARTVVRAYPLLPDPVIMMNALHSLQGQAPVVPLLGPPPTPLATARTLRDLQQGFLPSKALPPGFA